MTEPGASGRDAAWPQAVDFSRPAIARVYDYLLGGKDHMPPDRRVGDHLIAAGPAAADNSLRPSLIRINPQERGSSTYTPLAFCSIRTDLVDASSPRKKPDGIVNTLKIKMLNRLLSELSKVIENDPSYAFVDMLDEETLPQNSDAVLVLSQW
jgi:hypothetical protein